MPSRIPKDAMTPVAMLRSLRIPSSTNGMTKFTTTIPQNKKAKRVRVRTPKTAISEGSLPYQTVRCSASVKYSQRMLISNSSFARLSK